MKSLYVFVLVMVISILSTHAAPLQPPTPLDRAPLLLRREGDRAIAGVAVNPSQILQNNQTKGIFPRFGNVGGLPIRVMQDNAQGGTHPKAFPYANYQQDVANLVEDENGPAGGQQQP